MKSIFTFVIYIIFLLVLMISCGDREFNNPVDPVNRPTNDQLISEAFKEFSAKNYDVAIDKYQKVLETDAENVDSYNGLGWCYLKKHELTKAEENFKKNTEKQPDNVEANAIISGIYMLLDEPNFTQAIKSAHAALTASPNYVSTYDENVTSRSLIIVLAQAYLYTNDIKSAQEQLKHLGSTIAADNAEDLILEIEKLRAPI